MITRRQLFASTIMFWNTRREILLRAGLMIGLFLFVFLAAFIGWESNYVFNINAWKWSIISNDNFIQNNIIVAVIAIGVGLLVISWIIIGLIFFKKSRLIKIFCWSALIYLIIIALITSSWFIYLLVDYQTRTIIAILWPATVLLLLCLILGFWFLKRQLDTQFQLRTHVEKLQSKNNLQQVGLQFANQEITPDLTPVRVNNRKKMNWRQQINIAFQWRRWRIWWISAIGVMITIILMATALSVAFLKLPAINNPLDYPALPAAVQTVISQQYNDHNGEFAQNMQFRFPADNNKTAFIDQATAKDLTTILDSKKTLTAVFNNHVIKDQLAAANISLLAAEDQREFNNQQLYINYNGFEEGLKLKPIMIASNYDNEAGHNYNNYGEITLKSAPPKQAIPTYNLQLRFGIAFVIYNPYAFINYLPTNINFKTTITTTNSVNVLKLINNLKNLTFLQRLATPPPGVSWEKSLLNSLFNSFYELASPHLSLMSGRPNFLTSNPILLNVRYDNRYITNLQTQLNQYIWTISDQNAYQYTNQILQRIITNYYPLQLVTDNKIPSDFPIDKYSGYVPGFSDTDNQAAWGSKLTKFNGGFAVKFLNFQTPVAIEYQQMSYANHNKTIKPIQLPLESINNQLLANIQVTSVQGAFKINWSSSESFPFFLNSKIKTVYKTWTTLLNIQFAPYLQAGSYFSVDWHYTNLGGRKSSAVTVNDILNIVPGSVADQKIKVESKLSISTVLQLSSSKVSLTFPNQYNYLIKLKTIIFPS